MVVTAVNILLTEDDPIVAELYRLRLEADGHAVTVAADGEAALEAVRRARPTLVLLDIRMPKMGGVQVLEALRADPALKDLPVVMLTNYSDPNLVERCLALGAAGYLVKSRTTPRQLVEWIESWRRKTEGE